MNNASDMDDVLFTEREGTVVEIFHLRVVIPHEAKVFCNGVEMEPEKVQAWLNLFDGEARKWSGKMRSVIATGRALTVPGHPIRPSVVDGVFRFDQAYIVWLDHKLRFDV